MSDDLCAVIPHNHHHRGHPCDGWDCDAEPDQLHEEIPDGQLKVWAVPRIEHPAEPTIAELRKGWGFE